MPSPGSVRAGRAFVEVFADNTALVRGLKAAEAKVKGFGTAIAGIGGVVAGIGAAITAPFIAGLKGAMDLEDAMQATGVIFGDSADVIIKKSEEMAASARVVQGDFLIAANSFGAVFKGAGSTQAEAAKLGNMLTELGIDMASFGTNVSQEEAFMALRAAFRSEYDPIERFNVFITAAKVENEALASGLAKTKDEITDYAKKQAVLNLILKQTKDQQGDQLRSINTTKGVWTALTNTLTNISTQVGSAVAPVLAGLGKTVVMVAQGTLAWIKDNKGLLQVVFALGAGITAVGVVLVGLGATIWGLGAAFGVAATAVAAFGAVMGAILSPIGVTVAAVGGIVAAFLTLTDVGQSALSWLGDAFEQLRVDASAAFQGIGDALKSGDITLAAQILWGFLRVEWIKGINYLNALWADWGIAVTEVFRGVSYGLASAMIDAWAKIKATFPGAITFMQESFATFIGWVLKAWNNVGGFFAKTWERIKALFTGEDIEAKLAEIDRRASEANAAQDQATAASIAETRAGMTPERIEADRLAAQAALTDQQEAEKEARRKAAMEGLKAGEAELKAAQDELAALQATASEENDAISAAVGGGPGTFTPQELDRAIGGAKGKVDVAGSFSASALQGLGVGSSIENEQLKEQKKAVKELEKLNKKKAVFT